jgi:hypothetical protein
MAAGFWINSEGEFGRDDDVIGGMIEIGPGSAPIEEQQAAQLAQLSADELALLERWEELVPDESYRWRLYAHLKADGAVLLLSTEFAWWDDDEQWWAALRALAAEHGAEIEDMRIDEERGYWRNPPKTLDTQSPRAREHPSYVPAEHEGRLRAQGGAQLQHHGARRTRARRGDRAVQCRQRHAVGDRRRRGPLTHPRCRGRIARPATNR